MRPLLRISLCALFLLSGSLAFAQTPPDVLRYAEPTLLPPTGTTFPQLMQQYRMGGHSRVKAMVAWGDYEPIFIFPVAGTGAGNGGTFFHTASMITNHRSVAQDIQIYWFPLGGGSANCTRPSTHLQIPARTWYYWDDLAASVLNVSGFGGIAVAAVDSNGNLDSNGVLDGFSRIWTYIPGTSGSVSQSFVSESLNLDTAQQNAYGLEQDGSFRTNIGIFNYDTVERSFTISVSGQNGTGSSDVSVPACNVGFPIGAPGGNVGVLSLYITADDGRGLWYGFGSSVDNVSGAAWSSVAHP